MSDKSGTLELPEQDKPEDLGRMTVPVQGSNQLLKEPDEEDKANTRPPQLNLSNKSKSKRNAKKNYPRVEKKYENYSSIDFQLSNSNIWRTLGDPKTSQTSRIQLWICFLLVGIVTGIAAFIIDRIVESFILWKWSVTQMIISQNKSFGLALLVFVSLSILFGGIAALLTVFVGPGAVGSGTTELMAYLNGINYPKFIGIRTLFVKIFGTSLAVSAGLCIGKEGPLAHIGANIGQGVLYLPFDFLRKFRNNVNKREIACAGAAAGVSAAFGSPIGGTLFIYEVSRPSAFWSFELTWQTFFCSCVSTFMLGMLSNIGRGGDASFTNTGLIKFGHYSQESYEGHDIPFFLVLGVCGGLLGSFFNFVNGEINKLRSIYINTSVWKRILETLLLVTITSLLLFYAPLITASNCEHETDKLEAEFIQYTCPEGQFNPLATLLLNPEGTTIKAFLNQSAIFNYSDLLLHFMIWYVMTILTYGTAVPAGLFLPGILIGCSLGRMLSLFIKTTIGQTVLPATYAIIGAASVLAGYTRLSFSLAVIMLETTENVNLFLPVVAALFVSFAVGRLFNRSLYAFSLGFKNIPFLVEAVPKYNAHLKAEDIMSSEVSWLTKRVNVKIIGDMLRDTEFNGFPIISDASRPIGVISRHVLMCLMAQIDCVEDCGGKSVLLGEQNKRDSHSDSDYRQSVSQHESVQSADEGEFNKFERPTAERRPSLSEDDSESRENQSASEESNSTNHQDAENEMRRLHPLTWTDFTVDLHSATPEYESVKALIDAHEEKCIDLRPYMQSRPYSCNERDKIQKVLDLFRLMNLRQLPVLQEETGLLKGIITRQDLFKYMEV